MHQNELHIAVSAGQSLSEWLHAIILKGFEHSSEIKNSVQ